MRVVRTLGRIASWLSMACAAVSCAQMFDYPESEAEQTASRCGDRQDNDLDGKTDCEDSECEPFCLENTDERCHDDEDNDLDGDKDCAAPECAEYCVEHTDVACHDGKDNDRNGQTDCQDPQCGSFCPESDATACSDETDNDSDGEIDCEDRDCDGFCPEETPSECNDERDNDGDELTDAADPRCWLHSAPKVQRCAQVSGVEFFEAFDTLNMNAPWIFSEWTTYGSNDASAGLDVFATGYHSRGVSGPREDGLVVFTFNTTQSNTLDTNLGGLLRTWQFSGSWQGFELSFNAAVPLGAMLRVGIVPAELAAPFEPTLPGAESALLSVTIDTAHAPPTLALDVHGARLTTLLPVTRALCAGGLASCAQEDMSKVRVVLDDQGFRVTLKQLTGEQAELRAPPPSERTLPPSRLVFWGGTTAAASLGLLDDVYLRVAPEYPCGVPSPQIPGRACELSADLRAFGRGVSLARGTDGEYCALASASADSSTLSPQSLTAWKSSHGEVWEPATSQAVRPLELPADSTLIGAGITHDRAGFHLAVAYREAQTVKLGTAVGQTCGAWGPLTPGPALFADAEAPSYVVDDAQVHAVYFTRPPTDETRRTLWRSTRATPGSSWLEPELLAELPANVASPVSVRRIGTRDLVLVHPTALSGGTSGVGLLIGSDGGRSWSSLEPSPILDIPKLPQNYGGSLSFDEEGVLAAALEWNASGGFLLYGAQSPIGLNTSETKAPRWPSKLAVGTARMVRAGEDFPQPSSEPVKRCGDGQCDLSEACATCPEDCTCEGALLLSDVLQADEPWLVSSSDQFPARVSYLDADRPALHWSRGRDTWSLLPLERSISGDFELSFDFVGEYLNPGVVAPCSVYVGLASTRDPEALATAGGDVIEAGVFTRFTYAQALCFWQYWTAPLVQVGGSGFTSPVDESVNLQRCEVRDHYWSVETRRRIVLRREGRNVSMGVARDDACGLAAQSIEYSGALPELTALAVGFGGGSLTSCTEAKAYGTITNLRLRLLDDPERCPDDKLRCGDGSHQPTCVDTQRSSEHCGSCGHACGENQACERGRCVCNGNTGILACADECVDSLSDIAHCGACGKTCARNCIDGVCDVVTGECDWPIPLPETGGTVMLDFSKRKPNLVPLCEGVPSVTHLQVFEWTPSHNGVATITAQQIRGLAVMVFGITTNPECAYTSWINCGRGGGGDPDIPIVLPVAAGTTYRVAVGLSSGDPTTSAALTIEVEP